jgi:phosphoglycerate dehydrogenase-like enzyme
MFLLKDYFLCRMWLAHVDGRKSNENIIDAQTFENMKDGVIF